MSGLIIDPDLAICDAHHHLGTRGYSAADYRADLSSGHRVESSVAIECGAFYGQRGFVDETSTLRAITDDAKAPDIAAAIVARIDLRADDVEAAITAHAEAAGGRLAGVRHIAAFDADPSIPLNYAPAPPDLYRDDDFHRGFARLAPARLVFEAWQYHPQLPDLLALARAYPATTIVIDHVGGPLGVGRFANMRQEVLAEWRRSMADLAELPNTVVKLGGLGMRLSGFSFAAHVAPTVLAEAWRPYIETCIELFGAKRAMFESNFPVDRHSCDYPTLWNAFKLLTTGASDEEKTCLFNATARRVYRIA